MLYGWASALWLLVEHRLMKPQDLRHVNNARFLHSRHHFAGRGLIGVLLGIYI